MAKKVTVKEIAQKTGASISTVHRVLHNKEGVGPELREKILKVSQELGYSVNYLASNLKNKTKTIVSIFPNGEVERKYFLGSVLNGYIDCKKELSSFNLAFKDLNFDYSESALYERLKDLFETSVEEIDGMIVTPFISKRIETILNRFCDRGVSVILVDIELEGTDHLCCVKSNNKVAGKMAGELLGKYLKTPGKVLIAAGDIREKNSHADNYLNGLCCEKMLKETNPEVEVEFIHETFEDGLLYKAIFEKLKQETNIVGIYSTTARNTASISKALVELELEKAITFIGSELFDENIEMLNNGVIDTIIYKNPYQIGYQSLYSLFEYLVKGEKPKKIFEVEPTIVLKSNLDLFKFQYDQSFKKGE